MKKMIRDGMGALILVGFTACAGSMPTNLGLREGSLAACPSSPNCVTSGDADEAHSVAALEVEGDPAKAWDALVELLESEPDARIVTNEGIYLHAEFTSALMRYVDDVEFAMSVDRSEIDVRSASRVGYGDMSANRERVERVRDVLAARGVVRPTGPAAE